MVKGPNVMQGYYKLPGERPFTSDGWFLTGDVGELDADGYLSITDRKKELIKTSGGKYVAPGRVESALKRSIYIGQCFVIGDGRPYPIALVGPNWDLVRADFEIPASVTTEEISKRSDVRELLQARGHGEVGRPRKFRNDPTDRALAARSHDRGWRTLAHAESEASRRAKEILRAHRVGIRDAGGESLVEEESVERV